MLTGSVCIASNTRAAINTLQTVAPIPAFKAGSILWLRRRADLAAVALVFAGIRFSAVCLVTHLPEIRPDNGTSRRRLILKARQSCERHDCENGYCHCKKQLEDRP